MKYKVYENWSNNKFEEFDKIYDFECKPESLEWELNTVVCPGLFDYGGHEWMTTEFDFVIIDELGEKTYVKGYTDYQPIFNCFLTDYEKHKAKQPKYYSLKSTCGVKHHAIQWTGDNKQEINKFAYCFSQVSDHGSIRLNILSTKSKVMDIEPNGYVVKTENGLHAMTYDEFHGLYEQA